MHKDDLKKLYPNAADFSDGTPTGSFMNETVELTPTASMLDLARRCSSTPVSKASGQSMDLTGFGSSSSAVNGFKICNENKVSGIEDTMSCAGPASQILSVHSKSEEGKELSPHFSVFEEKLMPSQSTFATVDQEPTALESDNMIPSVSSSHIATAPFDTVKPPEECAGRLVE